MEIKHFDKEFVERTKYIIENIDHVAIKFEITLLLNCMMGLISLPTERTDSQDNEFKSSCVQKLRQLNVIHRETNDDKTFRAVKNALSHMYIEPINQDAKIELIILRDKVNREANYYHTELIFSAQQLKEFALFVAELHLSRYDE